MDRRAFVWTFAGSLLAAPLAAKAQPAPGQVHRIGFFTTFPVDPQKTAKALGLTIPPSLLQRADQVIE